VGPFTAPLLGRFVTLQLLVRSSPDATTLKTNMLQHHFMSPPSSAYATRRLAENQRLGFIRGTCLSIPKYSISGGWHDHFYH
jgi:hypothetical protein